MSDSDSADLGFDTADFDGDDKLRALLRGADPVGALPPADPAALRSLLEDIMSADLDVRPAEPAPSEARRHTRATWLVAAAAVAVIAAGGAFAVTGLTGNDSHAPQADQPTSHPAPQADAGLAGQTTQLKAGSPQDRCAPLTTDLLAQYDQAFEGTVTSVDGDTITFQTTDVYVGQVGETVQLTAPPAGVAKILDHGRTFTLGQSYLVPAYHGAISMCGYTGPATGDLKSLFQKAFVH